MTDRDLFWNWLLIGLLIAIFGWVAQIGLTQPPRPKDDRDDEL
jgi:hypothetical protein